MARVGYHSIPFHYKTEMDAPLSNMGFTSAIHIWSGCTVRSSTSS